MKKVRMLMAMMLVLVSTLPLVAQVSNDNEDGAYKIDPNLVGGG